MHANVFGVKKQSAFLCMLVVALFVRGSPNLGVGSYTMPQFVAVSLVLSYVIPLAGLQFRLNDIVVSLVLTGLMFILEVVNSLNPILSIKLIIIALLHLYIKSCPVESRLAAYKLYGALALVFFLYDVYVRFMISGVGFDLLFLAEALVLGWSSGYGPSKLGSPFFYDSNFSAVLPLVVGLIMLQLFIRRRARALLVFIIFFVGVMLSLSRSALGVFLLCALYIYWRSLSLGGKLFVGVSIGGLVFLIVPYLGYYLSSDYSWSTKSDVLDVFFGKIFWMDVVPLLVGFGSDAGRYVFGYEEGASAHLLVPTLVGQVGILGFGVYLCFWWWLIRSDKQSFLAFFIMMMLGISVVDPFDLYIFVPFALMVEKRPCAGERRYNPPPPAG